jgi:hypothetical protein
MHNIIKNPDGTVTVTLDQTDLNVIGAGIWAGKEEGNLYGRFFPDCVGLGSPKSARRLLLRTTSTSVKSACRSSIPSRSMTVSMKSPTS